jgi:hypothetical protein
LPPGGEPICGAQRTQQLHVRCAACVTVSFACAPSV